MSFLIKNSFSLENFGANLFFIVSLKKNPTNKYNSVAPIVVDVKTISMPHHLPNTKPENIKRGIAKPKNKTHTIVKTKKIEVNNKKFSFLYLRIMSLFSLINS